MAVVRESGECMCVSLILAALTVIFSGLLALVIHQHSKEVSQAHLHSGGETHAAEGGRWGDASGGHDKPNSAAPAVVVGGEPRLRYGLATSAAKEQRSREALDDQQRPARSDATLRQGVDVAESYVNAGPLSQLVGGLANAESAARAHDERGEAADNRARQTTDPLATRPPPARFLPSFQGIGGGGARGAYAFSNPVAESTAAETSGRVTSSAPSGSSGGRAAVASVGNDNSSASLRYPSNATAAGGGLSASTFGAAWESASRAFRQTVEVRWLVVAVAATAVGTLAFAALVVAVAARRGRPTFNAPDWWSAGGAASSSSRGGRHRDRRRDDWLSLLSSSDDDCDGGNPTSASRGRSTPQRRRAASELRRYVDSLRALDKVEDETDGRSTSRESTPIVSLARKYDSTSR